MSALVFGCDLCIRGIWHKTHTVPDQTVARDAAIAAVEDPPWQSFAIKAIGAMRVPFTSDDVWHELDRLGVPRPPEPRAMGAAMRRATKLGIIEPTDQFRISSRPASPNHRRPQRIYTVR